MENKTINLTYKELYIAYVLDQKSVNDLANEYGITYTDMRDSLRSYGIAVRKTDKQPEAPKPSYTINLVDTDKTVEKKDKVMNTEV